MPIKLKFLITINYTKKKQDDSLCQEVGHFKTFFTLQSLILLLLRRKKNFSAGKEWKLCVGKDLFEFVGISLFRYYCDNNTFFFKTIVQNRFEL